MTQSVWYKRIRFVVRVGFWGFMVYYTCPELFHALGEGIGNMFNKGIDMAVDKFVERGNVYNHKPLEGNIRFQEYMDEIKERGNVYNKPQLEGNKQFDAFVDKFIKDNHLEGLTTNQVLDKIIERGNVYNHKPLEGNVKFNEMVQEFKENRGLGSSDNLYGSDSMHSLFEDVRNHMTDSIQNRSYSSASDMQKQIDDMYSNIRNSANEFIERGKVSDEPLENTKRVRDAVRKYAKDFIERGKVSNEPLEGTRRAREYMQKVLTK